jgi:enoyl-CoA hydratase/carnithine racemase
VTSPIASTLFQSDTLICQLRPDLIALLTINRAERHNALDLATMEQLAALIEALHERTDVRVLIVTGAGESAFCSGGDLADLSSKLTEEDARALSNLMGNALRRLEQLPFPVIAAINGFALGGGAEVALACDLRVIDEKARIGFVQARRGLSPGWGGGQRLLRVVGYARALELLARANALRADDIIAMGLASRVAPAGGALAAALEIAHEIAHHDPLAVRAGKALLQAGMTQPYEQALITERALFPALWAGATHHAAMQEFIDKQNGK